MDLERSPLCGFLACAGRAPRKAVVEVPAEGWTTERCWGVFICSTSHHPNHTRLLLSPFRRFTAPIRISAASNSFRDGIIPEREGVLMGVELGEASVAEQDSLESLLSNYSFHDASIGVVALSASIYYFGEKGRNDVNVLTLLAVAVVAGLNQEASLTFAGYGCKMT